MRASIEFDSVSRSFGANRVLDNISLALPAQKTTAVVGASGSGKSTLLRHINAMERPDSGTVRVFGEPVPRDSLTAFRRRIGYAVQAVGLFPHLTVARNVTLLAELDGWTKDEIAARLDSLMRLMELPADLRHRYPHQLSGGQQQRVGLCRAMMLKPELLLLDEPFSGVDPITRGDIHREFERLQAAEPVSVVLVTHDMREARRLSQYLVVLRDGAVLHAGPTAEALENPGHPYVARLVEEQLA